MIDIRNEWWLAKRIFGRELCTIFLGVTDVQIRMARMRAAIIDRGLADKMVGKKDTYAILFKRLYGMSLEQKAEAAA
jgi:hypothetical protein